MSFLQSLKELSIDLTMEISKISGLQGNIKKYNKILQHSIYSIYSKKGLFLANMS